MQGLIYLFFKMTFDYQALFIFWPCHQGLPVLVGMASVFGAERLMFDYQVDDGDDAIGR